MSAPPAGANSITAIYSGDGDHAGGIAPSCEDVDWAVVPAPYPAVYGQSVTFTSTLPAGATGTVSLLDRRQPHFRDQRQRRD